MATIVLVRGDDWEGLYVDGQLHTQGHSIDARHVLNLIGGRAVYLSPPQDNALRDRGSLPAKLDDVFTLGT